MSLPTEKQSYYVMMKNTYFFGNSFLKHNPVDLLQKPLRQSIQKCLYENQNDLATFSHVSICTYV